MISRCVTLMATQSAGKMTLRNADGLRVLHFGPMRAQLRGIEAVLADGTVLSHLAGLVKDKTGYDYPSLLAGSEGTLAVVTRARLRLVLRLRDMVTALAGVRGRPRPALVLPGTPPGGGRVPRRSDQARRLGTRRAVGAARIRGGGRGHRCGPGG